MMRGKIEGKKKINNNQNNKHQNKNKKQIKLTLIFWQGEEKK